MHLSKTIVEIQKSLSEEKAAGKRIAFVPTMGALHDGHLALIKKARQLAEIVVVSIFVNKTQFNDLSDFEKYPRQVESDLEKLKNSGIDYVFLPDDGEIFPQNSSFKISPLKLVNCLCGVTRSGHFDGVALIVTKLFNIIKPNIAVFGQKDFQQFKIIQRLVKDLNFDIEIFGHETLREKSGLAMSSRNSRLNEDNKIKAAEIYQTLLAIKNNPNLIAQKHQELLQNGFEKIDYLEIRDEENLEIISDFTRKIPSRIFIAVYLAGVRLIDNMPL